NHNLSVSGGTETSNYYTSVGYLDQKGIVTPNASDYKRMTFKVNTSFKPKKYLSFGENFNYAYIRSTSTFNQNSYNGGPLSDAINLDTLTPVLVNDINSQPNASTYTAPDGNPANAPYIVRNSAGIPYGISNNIANEIVNPLAAEQLLGG